MSKTTDRVMTVVDNLIVLIIFLIMFFGLPYMYYVTGYPR